MMQKSIVRLVSTSAFVFALSIALSLYSEDKKPDGKALVGKDTSGWVFKDKEAGPKTWHIVSKAGLDAANPKRLTGQGEGGDELVLLRGTIDHGSDIYTEEFFGDVELHVEFMVPKTSNSGIYLMGQYEVQVFDSFGKTEMQTSDCGGIYSVRAPSVNASKAPGEWQSFDIVFRAPRFDDNGKKTENARFLSVILNGKEIQKNVEVKKPTGGELPGGEKATGPIMIQGDHGEVALRNVRVKSVKLD